MNQADQITSLAVEILKPRVAGICVALGSLPVGWIDGSWWGDLIALGVKPSQVVGAQHAKQTKKQTNNQSNKQTNSFQLSNKAFRTQAK